MLVHELKKVEKWGDNKDLDLGEKYIKKYTDILSDVMNSLIEELRVNKKIDGKEFTAILISSCSTFF